MIQYGGELRTQSGVALAVEREQSITTLALVGATRTPITAVRLSYPQLLSLITRLTEAAKDAAKEKR